MQTESFIPGKDASLESTIATMRAECEEAFGKGARSYGDYPAKP